MHVRLADYDTTGILPFLHAVAGGVVFASMLDFRAEPLLVAAVRIQSKRQEEWLKSPT